MSYGVGHRRCLDPALLWLWHRLAAVSPIHPLWKLPYAVGAAQKEKKKEGVVYIFIGILLSHKKE